MLGGKKNNLPLRLNGTERIAIKTLHGSFSFTNQRFLLPDGSAGHYFGLTGQSSISSGIEEFCLYFCNRLSFSEVVKLVERVSSGEGLLCEQTLWNWVQKKAREISGVLSGEVEVAQSLPFPAIAEVVEIYDEEAEEVLVSTDAIQVKAQKRTRERAGHGPKKEWEKKAPKRINTDLMLVQGRDGSFRCLCGGLDGRANLFELAQAHLRREWGERSEPLPIVAITDGARHIRLMLENLFGSSVRVILDWYHLSKKVYQLLSMVAHSSKERRRLQKQVLALLWRGCVGETLSFLGGVLARRKEALDELVSYLEKHASEIIDYERRRKVGKAIGSGRMEKALDRAVGMRQKKKGMSWSEAAIHALALLKVVELNGEWKHLWDATHPLAA